MSLTQQKTQNRKSKTVSCLKPFGPLQARRVLPKRMSSSNKTTGGRALVLAGSAGFAGAAVLSATAASRAGAGYTHLATALKNFSHLKNPDFLVSELRRKDWQKLKVNAIAIGPGLGVSKETESILRYLLKLEAPKVVVDADALTVIANAKLYPLPQSWILTPHEGELSRMIGWTADAIRKARPEALAKAQEKYQCVVLLKGHPTLVADGEVVLRVQSGNPALGKAGTGDVLTGMIVGFLAQGLSPLSATLLGAYLHGRMADDWVKQGNDYLSLMASDLLGLLPQSMAKLRRGRHRQDV